MPLQYDEKKSSIHAEDGLGRIVSTRKGSVTDAVFGEVTEEGPNYRDVGWLGTVALMMKTQIGLGVLSIPAVFDTLGLIPGIICLLAIGGITTWSGYYVGVFKRRHPQVYGIDDAGQLIFGRIGREIFGTAFTLFWIFTAGSGMLGISVSLNAVSTHATCTAVFVAVAAIIGCGLSSIQTLGRITWLAWVGLICILSAILTLTVAVGVQDRPSDAPQVGPWSSDYQISNQPTFQHAASALGSLVFAYAGTPAFFCIVSEMRDPEYYTRSLFICQAGITAFYITIGIVVYYFCGSYVASPALGSAGPLFKKICYGLALPGLIVSTTLLLHYPAKYVFVRLLRGSRHMTKNTPTHWAVWMACTVTTALIAYIIASVVPVFNELVALVGALLGTLMCFQPMGLMWLYDHWGIDRSARSRAWPFMVGWSIFVIVSGTFLMIAGSYGSILDIIDTYNGESAAWSCKDNSNSVPSS